MPLMSKKKPTTEQSTTPAPNRRGAALHVWIDPALMSALDAYLNSLKHPTTKTAVAEASLRAFLQAEGFWPPPAAASTEPSSS